MNEPYNLPKDLIKRFELIESNRSINASFTYNCRIFEMAEIGDTFIMECNLQGEPVDNMATVMIRKGKMRNIIAVSHDSLKEMSKSDLLKMINQHFIHI